MHNDNNLDRGRRPGARNNLINAFKDAYTLIFGTIDAAPHARPKTRIRSPTNQPTVGGLVYFQLEGSDVPLRGAETESAPKNCTTNQCWCVSDGGLSCSGHQCDPNGCWNRWACPGNGYRCADTDAQASVSRNTTVDIEPALADALRALGLEDIEEAAAQLQARLLELASLDKAKTGSSNAKSLQIELDALKAIQELQQHVDDVSRESTSTVPNALSGNITGARATDTSAAKSKQGSNLESDRDSKASKESKGIWRITLFVCGIAILLAIFALVIAVVIRHRDAAHHVRTVNDEQLFGVGKRAIVTPDAIIARDDIDFSDSGTIQSQTGVFGHRIDEPSTSYSSFRSDWVNGLVTGIVETAQISPGLSANRRS